ncbi:MAG TPA: ABC transporter permease [Pyrinomonadaceae bacterium]|nr:ABC transporter permease [Pyrinomonadaceae bacterium]
MRTLWQDLRYGARMLLKSPGVACVALLAIALGIGANTTIFSVVSSVLLRPLPFAAPDQLVKVWTTDAMRGRNDLPVSYPNFADWRSQSQTFETMTAYAEASATLSGEETPEQIKGVAVTADMFPVLGVKPLVGRPFTAEEEKPGSAPVVVISHGLWQRRFGSDRKVVGQQVTLDGKSTTIVGVMPPGFKFPLDAQAPELWAPLDPASEINQSRGSRYLSVVARLKAGSTLQQAQAEMETISQRLTDEHPTYNTGRGTRLITLYDDTVGEIRPALLVLLGAVGCVLLIACANVANILLARAAGRHKEMALRTALGASRRRIIRQLLTESMLLACIGGIAGLLLALWGVDVLVSFIPEGVPRAQEITVDARALGFTLGVSFLTGVIFGLAPALSSSRLNLNESLKEGGRGSTDGLRRNRVRGLLVVSEIALSLMLLIGAGLLIKSFQRLRDINPGFNPERVLTMSLSLPEAKYEEPLRQGLFFQELDKRVAQLPGVEVVGLVDPLPLSGDNKTTTFTIDGQPAASPADRLSANVRTVNAEYLSAMGIPLIKGRGFTERDAKDAPQVMLVNETLARRFFPGEDPVGKRATVYPFETPCEIVGVVGDVKHRGLDVESGPEFYISYLQAPQPSMYLVARTTLAEPGALASSIQSAVQQIDKDQPIADVRTMSQLLNEATAARRFNMLLLGVFALLALVLASVGIFGVMSYMVTQRTHEIGIRMALGARVSDVVRLIVGRGMTLVLIGVSVGLVGAFAVTRVMKGLLYGVSATDPLTFVGVSLVLSAVALVACLIPARRAARVDPMIALRNE